MDNKSKGFLTIGIGEYYRYLAKNLAKSYQLNTSGKTPFAIVTDKSDPMLEGLFSNIIIETTILNEPILYKLNIFHYSPFEETIFIDADCLIIRDIHFLWNTFRDVDFGVLGNNSEGKDALRNFFDVVKVQKEFPVNTFPVFNGGVYYFKKINRVKEILSFAKEIADRYDDFGMIRMSGARKNEEPLISLALGVFGVSAVKDLQFNTMYCTPGNKFFKIDIIKQSCSFEKYGTIVKPAIMHFLTGNTRRFHYKREVKKMNYYLKKIPLPIIRLLVLPKNFWYAVLVLGIRIIRRKKLNLKHLTPLEITKY